MKRKPQPIQEHAGSRYMCVTIRVIEVLQSAYLAGRPLGHVVPDIDADTAAVIVAESLEADQIWNLPPEQLLDGIGDGPMSDFKRAVLAEILFEIADVARDVNEEEKAGDWWALAMASLEEALRSPTASPMLWYEDIFYDLAQASRQGEEGDDQEAIYWLKGGLAHNLRHDDGSNALNSLRDLAEVHLSAGELDVGLKMLAALLRHDPSDIWTYNIMAISFDDYGLTELGTEVTRCGLELLDAKGDPNKLRDQLNDCLEQMKASEKHGREAEATPEVLTELRAALALDFDAGQPRPLDALCRELVPDLDEIPVKRPMRPSDIPLPEKPVRSHRITPPDRKPGRNAPCWCGSGKKYKHCHWREDQRQRR